MGGLPLTKLVVGSPKRAKRAAPPLLRRDSDRAKVTKRVTLITGLGGPSRGVWLGYCRGHLKKND